jgi:RNA polymerase-interacting CarD/CdnL/TRCF family regulator
MEFQIDQWVMHSAHGLGRVQGIEERTVNGGVSLYYVVQVGDLTIWVPVDENIQHRLRLPKAANEFKAIIAVLSEPAEALPEDFRLRNSQLQARLKGGDAEAQCKVIRDLTAHRQGRTWSTHDRTLVTTVRKLLIGEWCHSLSISREEAELELQRSLTPSGN